jgi:Tfp pilus assembly protein PilF
MDKYHPVIIACLLLTASTLAVFSPTFRNDFVNYDDNAYVFENPHVKAGLTGSNIRWAFSWQATEQVGNWHPLTWLSLETDSQLFGLGPWGYHLTNLLLHIANVLLLFAVLWRMTGEVWPSGFVAALFAIHPLHVESVAWVSERKDVLSTLFWMLTLLAYSWYVEHPSLKRYLLVVASFALGLMAKPMLVTLPFVLLLLDYWPLRRLTSSRLPVPGSQLSENRQLTTARYLILEKIPLFVLSAVSCTVTWYAQGRALQPLEKMPFSSRLGQALLSYCAYIGKMLWPTKLSAFYPLPEEGLAWPQVFAAGLLLVVLTFLVLRASRFPYLAVGWFWYLGTLVPVIGLVQVGLQSMADRYTYVPLIGLFLLAAWGVNDLALRWDCQRVAAWLGGGLVFILMLHSWSQCGYWSDGRRLWERALAVNPQNGYAENCLGGALMAAGEIDEGVRHYRLALESKPRYVHVLAHNNLASALFLRGKIDEAANHYKQALEIKPTDTRAHHDFAVLLLSQGKLQEAVEHLETAIRLDPGAAGSYCELGRVFFERGELDSAITNVRQAVELQPEVASYRCTLALLLNKRGETAEARQQYDESLRLDPQWLERNNIGARHWATSPNPSMRNGRLALELAEQICQATANQEPRYLDTLSMAYAELGRFDQAVAAAQQARDLAAKMKQDELVRQLENRIQLYKVHEPVRSSGSQ